MEFKKYNSLNQFHEVMKSVDRYTPARDILKKNDGRISYFSKPKIHGTNSGLVISDGKVRPFKRTSFIDCANDNCGFARWAENDFISDILGDWGDMTIYGEWAGPGIQSNVAVANIPRKTFFIFTIDMPDVGRIIEPRGINNFLPSEFTTMGSVKIIPIHDREIVLDFYNPDKLSETLETLNNDVEEFGKEDSYILEEYGVKGHGEGFVMYPDSLNRTQDYYELFSIFNFKAKSEHHRVNRTKKAISTSPEDLSSMNNFLDMFCTEQRFEQGWMESINREKDIKLLGTLIKWVIADIDKESKTEVEKCQIDKKKLFGNIGGRVASWYKAKLNDF